MYSFIPSSQEQSTSTSSENEKANTQLLGISFVNETRDDFLAQLSQSLDTRNKEQLFFINAHCLNIAYKHPHYRQTLNQADWVLPDGIGVKLGCFIQQDTLKENLNGTDLFPHICALLQEKGLSAYFLGGADGIAKKTADWVAAHYPALKISGFHHGYLDDASSEQVIQKINQSDTSVLFVAMGVPQQELWLSKHQHKLSVRLSLAVGGLFDFYSQTIPRAPKWLRESHGEWIWRLYQEPKRMWRRYILGNPLFLWRVLKSKSEQNHHQSNPGWKRISESKTLLKLRSTITRFKVAQSHYVNRKSKRLSDIVLSSYALIMLLPIFLLTALAIKLDSPGPVFFKQQRAGFRGQPFNFWKFRSMYIDAEDRKQQLQSQNEMRDGVNFKMKNDPRITRVGKFIRRYSIDELPQLINVLKGDMSVVGPRPAVFDELLRYQPNHLQRLDSIPGLTSEWVVAGRSDIPFHEQAKLDIDYLHRRSFWRDITLIFKTIPLIITGRGAY